MVYQIGAGAWSDQINAVTGKTATAFRCMRAGWSRSEFLGWVTAMLSRGAFPSILRVSSPRNVRRLLDQHDRIHCGSMSLAMIFTTRDACSKSDGAIVKVTVRRLSFGRSSSI